MKTFKQMIKDARDLCVMYGEVDTTGAPCKMWMLLYVEAMLEHKLGYYGYTPQECAMHMMSDEDELPF